MTTDKLVQFQVCLFNGGIEATTWSIVDTDCIVTLLEREIYGVTSKDQMRFTKEFAICLVDFEAWWQAIGVQELWNTIEQRVIHFRYLKMHLVSYISEWIQRMGSRDKFTTDISEWLHIGNVNEAYRSTTTVNYIQQMLKHNDRCTGLDCMEETLLYLALQGWYDIHSAKDFNLLSAANKRRIICGAHLLLLHHCQNEPFFCPGSQRVHRWRETHVRDVCRSIKWSSLRDASVYFGIPNLGQLFVTQIEDNWRHEGTGLVPRYDQNLLIDSIFIKLHNGLSYYCQPFHCPTCVERLGLDCKVE